MAAEEQQQQVYRDTRQRQHTEELTKALEQEKNVLEVIIENTGVQIAYLDPEFNFVRVNSAYAKGAGHIVEELIGRSHFDLFPNEENQAIFKKVRDTGKPVEYHDKPFEYKYQPWRGTTYWDWTLVPVKDASGRVQGLVLSLVETTERKNAEHNLRERVKELSCLYGIVSIADKLSASINELYQDIVSLLPPSWQYPEITCARITINGNKFETENYQDTQWKQSSDIMIYGNKVGIVEVCYLEERPHIYEGPFLKEERALIDAVAIHIGHITEHKRADEALQESHNYLERLTNSMWDAVFSVKMPERVIEWANDSFRLIGYDPKECVGRTTEFLYPDKSGFLDFGNKIKSVIAAGRDILHAEQLLKRKSGEVFSAEITTTIYKEKGEVVHVTSIVRDITERKKLDQLKDDFIGLVSHELRSPLTVITGAVNTVLTERERLSPEETRQLLRDAALEADSLSHLLGNLMELSRVQADRLLLFAEPISVKKVIQDTIEEIKRQSSAHQFVMDVPRELPPVYADELRMGRILYNLLENAVKYSPQGGEIRVFVKPGEEHLIIGVSDQGIGISRADQAKLFEPFQRLEDSRLDGVNGAGLGLSVCRKLVEAHGGQIWVESEPGKGSTFFFTIPLSHS
ncbi:Adaptive-response sensory-kinase SasA [subsurface metagenome]